jgi:KTSC domain-containing protein
MEVDEALKINGVLELEFPGNVVARFEGVPRHLCRGLIADGSPGRCFAQYIRDQFPPEGGELPRGAPGPAGSTRPPPPPRKKRQSGDLNPGFDPHGTRFGRGPRG